MNQTKYYDFSNQDDQKEVVAYYGGAEHMAACYPLMYKAFANACRNARVLRSTEETKKGFINRAQVHHLFYDSINKVYDGLGHIVLTKKVTILQGIIEIFKNGERIAADTKLFHNEQYCCLGLQTPDSEYQKGDEVILKVTAIWQDEDTLLKGCSDRGILLAGDYDYIAGYDNIHPKKQVDVYPENIRVSYGRIPTGDTYDYVYPESRDGQRREKVSLNLEGEVILKDGWSYQSLQHYEAFLWSKERGIIAYSGDEPVVTKTDKGFHYKFPVSKDSQGNEYCEWDDYIEDSVLFGNQSYDFNLRLEFGVADGNTTKIQSVMTTSIKNENPPVNYRKIPPIRLFWGCISADSLVKLKDGTVKQIEQLKVGDTILNEEHCEAVIEDIFTGQEKEILHIETESGRYIELCELHPIMTDKGFIQAKNITADTVFVMADGQKELVKYAYYKEYGKKVYSLSLAVHSNGFIANDFIVGSYETENSYKRIKKKDVANQKVLVEIKKLIDGFEYIG